MSDLINGADYLMVDDIHSVYWEDWGNPEGVPVLSLHGGPGSGFNDKHKKLFDPEKHHVLFHDQRGSGQSKPFAGTEKNTTQELVSDIEKLQNMAGFETAHVVGGSWGSALGLLYAIEHSERVKSMQLWGVYLGRQFENDWVNEGYPRYFLPTEWDRFIAMVPKEHRETGNDTMQYYAEKIRSDDEEEARRYATEWTLWESALTSIEYDPAQNEEEVKNDPKTTAVAVLETHYFMNNCFIPDNYILDSVDRISHIPASVVQGRYDMCTPPVSAYDLQKAYGENLNLQWVNSGHMRTDKLMFRALRKMLSQNLV